MDENKINVPHLYEKESCCCYYLLVSLGVVRLLLFIVLSDCPEKRKRLLYWYIDTIPVPPL